MESNKRPISSLLLRIRQQQETVGQIGMSRGDELWERNASDKRFSAQWRVADGGDGGGASFQWC